MSKLKAKIPMPQFRNNEERMDWIYDRLENPVSRSRSKVKMIDGKPHRTRRGTLVEIPEEWYGKVTHKQTIRKRRSKEHL